MITEKLFAEIGYLKEQNEQLKQQLSELEKIMINSKPDTDSIDSFEWFDLVMDYKNKYKFCTGL